jgi:hypothetical protein
MSLRLVHSIPCPSSSTLSRSAPFSKLIQLSIRVAPASKAFCINSFKIWENEGILTADRIRSRTGGGRGVTVGPAILLRVSDGRYWPISVVEESTMLGDRWCPVRILASGGTSMQRRTSCDLRSTLAQCEDHYVLPASIILPVKQACHKH